MRTEKEPGFTELAIIAKRQGAEPPKRYFDFATSPTNQNLHKTSNDASAFKYFSPKGKKSPQLRIVHCELRIELTQNLRGCFATAPIKFTN